MIASAVYARRSIRARRIIAVVFIFVLATPALVLAMSTLYPGVNDEMSALAVDMAGGVWVASFGHGLAYLAPMTHQMSYFDRARELPQDRLTAVAVERADVESSPTQYPSRRRSASSAERAVW